MYAKYARLRIDQVPMSRLVIRLRDPTNKSHIKFLKDSMQQILEMEGFKDQFTIWSYMDTLDNSHNVSDRLIAPFYRELNFVCTIG